MAEKNNKYYQDINIDESALNLLHDLTDLCGMTMDKPENDEEDLQPSDKADPSDVVTFVLVVGMKMNHQEVNPGMPTTDRRNRPLAKNQ